MSFRFSAAASAVVLFDCVTSPSSPGLSTRIDVAVLLGLTCTAVASASADWSLSADWPVKTLEYEFFFREGEDKQVSQAIRIEPQVYRTRTQLRLPLDGRVLVWDGHDFYSHHRRLDLDHPIAVEFALRSNAGRYSYDFVIVDEAGARFSGDPGKSANHYSYGRPVLAPKVDSQLKLDLNAMTDAAKGAGLVFFCNPNNPTATVHGKASVDQYVDAVNKASKDTMILIDEAYHEYVDDPTYATSMPLATMASLSFSPSIASNERSGRS